MPLDYSFVHREALQRDRDEVFRFLWDNREALGLCDEAYTEVGGVRPCLRVDVDGFTLRETVADYVQILTVRADELETIRIPGTTEAHSPAPGTGRLADGPDSRRRRADLRRVRPPQVSRAERRAESRSPVGSGSRTWRDPASSIAIRAPSAGLPRCT